MMQRDREVLCCRKLSRTIITTVTVPGQCHYINALTTAADELTFTFGAEKLAAIIRDKPRSWRETRRWWRTPGRRWSRRGSSSSCSGGRWSERRRRPRRRNFPFPCPLIPSGTRKVTNLSIKNSKLSLKLTLKISGRKNSARVTVEDHKTTRA